MDILGLLCVTPSLEQLQRLALGLRKECPPRFAWRLRGRSALKTFRPGLASTESPNRWIQQEAEPDLGKGEITGKKGV